MPWPCLAIVNVLRLEKHKDVHTHRVSSGKTYPESIIPCIIPREPHVLIRAHTAYFDMMPHAVPTHQTLQAFQGKRPHLGTFTFVAPNASVVGDVKLGNNSSIWYGAVLRGEKLSIQVLLPVSSRHSESFACAACQACILISM